MAVIILMMFAVDGRCTTYRAPVRPLTQIERLEISVSGAELVCVGRVESIVDSILPLTSRPGRYQLWRVIEFRPTRVLKGELPQRGKILVVKRQPGLDALVDVQDNLNKSNRMAVLFLRKVLPQNDPIVGTVDLPKGSWTLYGSPYGISNGMLFETEDLGSGTSRMLLESIDRQSIEAMARRADLIVIGENEGVRETCTVFGRSRPCSEIVVDSIVAGSEARKTIPVFGLILGTVPKDRIVAFLVRHDNGVYEVLSGYAGAVTIEKRSDKLQEQRLLTRIRTARADLGK